MGTLVDLTGDNQQVSLGSGGLMKDSGNLYVDVQSTSQNPSTLSADKVMAIYSLPAGSFDAAFRGVNIIAGGTFVSSGNAKRCKLIVNPTTPAIGSTVSGGTTIADSGSWTTSSSGTGWQISANVFKYGAFGANTQLAIHETSIMGVNVGGLVAPSSLTAAETSPIVIVVTCNVATTAADLGYSFTQIQGYN